MSYRSLNTGSISSETTPDPRGVDWWGVVFLLVVLSAFFAAIMFSWFYLRSGAESWPPEGTDRPALLLPSMATGALLASCLPLIWLQRELRQGATPRFNLALALSFVPGLLFLALQAIGFLGLDFGATDHAYGSAFFTITVFHATLIFGGLYVGAIVQGRAWKGHFSLTRHVAISCLSIYWYAVVAMWIVIYLSLYLLPYIE